MVPNALMAAQCRCKTRGTFLIINVAALVKFSIALGKTEAVGMKPED